MSDSHQYQEENIEALLKAAHPAEGKLDPRLRAGFYGRWVYAFHTQPAFPLAALGLICAVLFVLGLLVIGMAVGWIPASSNDLLIRLTAGIIVINLLSLPIASIFIVIRRKHA